jgi:energy-converting hydrogenase Eha subunit A
MPFSSLVVRVVAVIVAAMAIVNGVSALAGTWPSIQTRRNARTAPEPADAPPVATPGSSRLELLIFDRSWQ